MKWFLIGLAFFVTEAARADTAGLLYKQGADALSAGQYQAAVEAFDKVLTGYPNTPNIDDIRLRDGFAYMHLAKYPEAVDRLSKETLPVANPAYRGTALFYTGLAQFFQGLKLIGTDQTQGRPAFASATTTLTTLIDLIKTAPTPDNKGYLEEAIYYRALSGFEQEKYDEAEKDFQLVIQQFPTSLSRPEYQLRLGTLYAVETNLAVKAGKPTEAITAQAAQALSTFDQVSMDPNALVLANEANLSKGEILFLIAPLDKGNAGYEKALEAYRLVHRKDDLIQIQQRRLDDLKKVSAEALAASGAALANENSRLIDREQGRLETLKAGADPIIRALIRMGECYLAMNQPDEARVLLHRVTAHATLTEEERQEVDFRLLSSYVMSGQVEAADQALTDYLGKHPGDPQADGISFQIAAKLMERKDDNGALREADRSLKDFPKGTHVGEVHSLKARAYKDLGQLDQSTQELDLAVKAGGTGVQAIQNQLIQAQTMTAQGDFKSALQVYQGIRDNAQAGDLQAFGAAGYIQTLFSLNRFDEVIAEGKTFAAKYPVSKTLPSVLLFSGLSMSQKTPPDTAGSVAALQALVRKYPKDEVAPFALTGIETIDKATGNLPGMIQVANDLRASYPTAYTAIAQVADDISAIDVKDKKFDEALAQYLPLVDVPNPTVAATTRNKIGAIWIMAAKAMGAYQSMQLDARAEAEKKLGSAEQAYLGTLKTFPNEISAVGDAWQGMVDVLKQRRSWGLLTDAGMEAYLSKSAAGVGLTSPEMAARLEMAEAGLVFIYKNGAKQYPAALDRFKKVTATQVDLPLTRQEATQFGDLLVAAQDYATAQQVYNNLLSHAAPTDSYALADANYGLGAAYLAQGSVAQAAKYFHAMKSVDKTGAAWHPHIMEADYGLALAAEQGGDPSGEARETYGRLIQSPQASPALMAKSMLGYGRLLEKAGHGLTPTTGTTDSAVRYYLQVPTQFDGAVPALSAEGLFDAGQVYAQAGDKANARKQYQALLADYAQTAPEWAAKAQDALSKLGP